MRLFYLVRQNDVDQGAHIGNSDLAVMVHVTLNCLGCRSHAKGRHINLLTHAGQVDVDVSISSGFGKAGDNIYGYGAQQRADP